MPANQVTVWIQGNKICATVPRIWIEVFPRISCLALKLIGAAMLAAHSVTRTEQGNTGKCLPKSMLSR